MFSFQQACLKKYLPGVDKYDMIFHQPNIKAGTIIFQKPFDNILVYGPFQ